MSNYNPETGPIPLSEKGIAEMRYHLMETYINGDGWFNGYGIFTTFSRGVLDLPVSKIERGLPWSHGRRHWSEKLLNLSPRSWKLSINDKGLVNVTSKRTGRLRFQIQPEDIRLAESSLNGWNWVGKSQYLVHRASYHSDSESTRQLKIKRDQELDKILAAADQGKRPDYIDNSPFVKIPDPQYIGRRVMNLSFMGSLNETIEGVKDDGVVIDPRTKQLIIRIYEYPLSYEKWGTTLPKDLDF